MMKRLALFCGVFCCMAAVATAQDPKELGVSLRLGQFLPQGSAAREEGSKWVAAGVDFNLRKLGKSGPEQRRLTISVDFASKSDFSTIPLCINYLTQQNEFYWFFGAGVSYVEMPRQVGSVTEQDTSIEAAYQFGFGYSPNKGKSPLFVEVKYAGSGEDRLSGILFALGVRL